MEPIIETKSLTKRYGGIAATDRVSLQLEAHTITGLIGSNGSGKTTTLNMISGLIRPDGGDIFFQGKRVTTAPSYTRARLGIGTTFQLTRLFKGLSVMDNLLATFRPQNNETIKKAMELLEFFDLARLANEKASSLSYGQRKLLELSRALMLNPSILLLDEPAAGINPSTIDVMRDHIKKLCESGVSFLIVEHNLDFVRELCNTVFVMSQGRIIAHDSPSKALEMPAVLESYIGGN